MEPGPSAEKGAFARHPIPIAVERGDLDLVLSHFADDLRMNSPVTEYLLEGRMAREVLRVVLDQLEDVRYVDEHVVAGGALILRARARIRSRPVELMEIMEFDGENKVRDFSIYTRPMSGTAAIAAAAAPVLARRRARWRGRLVHTLTAPVPRIIASADSLITRLAGLRGPRP